MEVNLDEITIRELSHPDEIEDAKTAFSLGHYLGDCKPQYRRMYQVAEWQGTWVGILLWDQCVRSNSARDKYIGWSTEARQIHGTQVVNNKRFCIGDSFCGINNLGSRILGLAVKALPEAWREKYGEDLLLCETYVDPERYAGTSYKAAGWEYVGESAGYDKRDKKTGQYVKTHPKKVFLKPLTSQAKELLNLPYRSIRGELDDHKLNRKIALDFSKLDLPRLRSSLEAIPDHRSAQGRRHSASSLLLGISLAVFTGCSGFQAIWQWLASLAPSFRKELGMRKPPSVSTISRFMRNLDIQALDQAVYTWLSEQAAGISGQTVISLDGKTLRGTKDSEGNALEVVSAVLSPIGITVGQSVINPPQTKKQPAEIIDKTNEIPVVQKMLQEMPDQLIAGKIIVADAIHTQTKTAEICVKKKPTFCSVQKAIRAI